MWLRFKPYIGYSLSALILIWSLAAWPMSEYTIRTLSAEGKISFALTLPDSPATQRLTTRGIEWGLQSQIENPRCNNQPLQLTEKSHWQVPAHCTNITWQVTPLSLPAGSIDAANQLTVFIPQPGATHNKLILLSESTSLLRPVTDGQSQLTANFPIELRGAQALEQGAWLVPDYRNAPEFYLIGKSEVDKEVIDPITISYFSDNPSLTQRYGLIQRHKAVLSYLTREVLAHSELDLTSRQISLLVIFLGSDEQHQYLGGAAGRRSFVANYLYGKEANLNLNNAKSMLIIAHEQFHQLLDMLRGTDIPTQPAWIEESLAQYYGLKALAHTTITTQSLTQIQDHFIQPSAPVTESLMALEARFKQGDYTVYPLFYSQGATFWYELEQLLKQYSPDQQGLSPWLIPLITAKPDIHGGLPAEFRAQMIRIAGEPMQQLISRYVAE